MMMEETDLASVKTFKPGYWC